MKEIFLLLIVFLAAFCGNICAATVKWDGDTNLEWNEGTNWDNDAIPTSSDDVIIDDTNVSSSQAITATTTPIEYNSLSISSTAYSHSLTLSVNASGGSVTIGSGGTLDGTDQTITCSGNWDASAGTFDIGTSIVDLTGTGNVSNEIGTNYIDFHSLKCAAADQTTTIVDDLWVRYLTVGSGALTDGGADVYTMYLSGTGNVFTDGGATLTLKGLRYRPSRASSQNIAGRDYSGCASLGFYAVGGGGAGAADSYCEMQGSITADFIWIYSNNTSAEDVTATVLRTNNHNITANALRIGVVTYNYGAIECGSSSIDINGNVTCPIANECYIDADTSTWNVSGDWNNSGGTTFTADQSTIILDGSDQAITGTHAFYNLTKQTASADTLTIDNTATITVSNNLTLEGASGQNLSLRSDSDGAQYSLTVNQGAGYSMEYLDIKDCDASGDRQLDADKSTNTGNNSNITFDAKGFFDVF